MRIMSKLVLASALAGISVFAHAADLAILRNGFSVRHERREQVGSATRLYFSSGEDSGYVDVPAEEIASFQHDDSPAPVPVKADKPTVMAGKPATTSAPDLKRIVSDASNRHMVDADLIASVIRAESNYNQRAVSPKGAQGLMQLMPGTARVLGVDDAFEPEANVNAGTRYLRDLLLHYNGDIPKALAAYNAGAHRVEQYQGVPPYRETHAYVARVVRDFNRKKLAARKTANTAAHPASSQASKQRPSSPTE
jgi:soluble lytic murein transglycosylase-like protein